MYGGWVFVGDWVGVSVGGRLNFKKEILLKIKPNENIKISNFGSKLPLEIRYF